MWIQIKFEPPRTDCIHTRDMDSEWPMIFKEAFFGNQRRWLEVGRPGHESYGSNNANANNGFQGIVIIGLCQNNASFLFTFRIYGYIPKVKNIWKFAN
jgi:hypothetical protein